MTSKARAAALRERGYEIDLLRLFAACMRCGAVVPYYDRYLAIHDAWHQDLESGRVAPAATVSEGRQSDGGQTRGQPDG